MLWLTKMDERDEVKCLFQAVTRKPVRWLDERTSRGDFENRSGTLEVFYVPAADQYPLYQRLQPLEEKASERLGQPIRILFHTPEETTRLYPWVRLTEAKGGMDTEPLHHVRARARRRDRIEICDVDPRWARSAPPRTVDEFALEAH
jgi:hypothetical protein